MARKKQMFRYAVVMYHQNEMIFSRFIAAQSLKDATGFMAYVFPLYQQVAGAVVLYLPFIISMVVNDIAQSRQGNISLANSKTASDKKNQ